MDLYAWREKCFSGVAGEANGRKDMNTIKKRAGMAAVVAGGMLACSVASAAVISMNFDDMTNATNGELVDNFYNGGCGTPIGGGPADCGGPNYGVVWTGGAVAGGAPNGNFNNTSNEPSGPNVMGTQTGYGTDLFMNVAAGFTTGFSFYYAAAFDPGAINVYSGLNGTGTLLATLTLPVTGDNCDGLTDFSCWNPIGVSFSGTAVSVDFSGTEQQIVFDNITLGSATPVNPVPEPAELATFGLGAMLLGAFLALRRREQRG